MACKMAFQRSTVAIVVTMKAHAYPNAAAFCAASWPCGVVNMLQHKNVASEIIHTSLPQ